MLAHEFRLPARTHLSHPTTYHTHFFITKVEKTALPSARFGFVVGKKVSSLAVERNRVKRLLRSCVEELLPQVSQSVDMLFILKKDILTATRPELFLEVSRILRSQNVLQS